MIGNEFSWSNYWSTGAASSFFEKEDDPRVKVVRNEWKKYFLKVKPKGLALDIGCGNGTLCKWIADFRDQEGLKFEIIGVDAANVSSKSSRYKLVENINYEDFNSDNNDIFLITSQFGFEYGDINRGLKKIYSLLNEDGQFIALSHDVESDLLARNKLTLELLIIAKNMFETEVTVLISAALAKHRGESAPDRSNFSRSNVNGFINRFAKTDAFLETGFMMYIESVLRSANSGNELIAKRAWAEAINSIDAHISRLTQLVESAQKISNWKQLKGSLLELGFRTVEISPFKLDSDYFIGNFIRCVK